MLPETKDGRDLFGRIRENRGRYRTYCLKLHGGDMEAVKREEMGQLALEADLAGFREELDFMASEDMLTPEQLEAAKNISDWARLLMGLLPAEAK